MKNIVKKIIAQNPFAGMRKVAVVALCVVLAGGFYSCGKNAEYSDTVGNVTGTIIGNYSNGFTTLLVQIDKKYPIGETVEYIAHNCTHMSNEGTYKNVIQVQPFLPPLDWTEGEAVIGKRISFSYREFQHEEDCELFYCYIHGNAMCVPPAVPIYVITNYQILM